MEPIRSEFFFWGRRNYVQGSHIIEEFLRAFEKWGKGNPEEFLVSFSDPIATQGLFVPYPDKQALAKDRKQLCAELQGRCGSEDVFIGLKPEQEEILETIPDDEDVLTQTSHIWEDEFSISFGFRRNRFYSGVVANDKKMLNTLLGMQGYAPWKFVRLSFQHELLGIDHAEVRIRLSHNIGNVMTKGIVLLDDTKAGEIQFIRKKL